MAVSERAVATLPKLIGSLRKQLPKPKAPHQQLLPSLRRAFSLYDQINLIDNVPEDQLRFQRMLIVGYLVLEPNTCFLYIWCSLKYLSILTFDFTCVLIASLSC
ncbi:hypothetical protein UlMin_036912 [Ulmus minor]